MSDAMYYIARKRCAERSRKMKKLPLAVLLLTLYAGISGCNDVETEASSEVSAA